MSIWISWRLAWKTTSESEKLCQKNPSNASEVSSLLISVCFLYYTEKCDATVVSLLSFVPRKTSSESLTSMSCIRSRRSSVKPKERNSWGPMNLCFPLCLKRRNRRPRPSLRWTQRARRTNRKCALMKSTVNHYGTGPDCANIQYAEREFVCSYKQNDCVVFFFLYNVLVNCKISQII